jgi:hypothetical protein
MDGTSILVINTQLAAVIGLFSPFLIALIQRPTWSSKTRAWVTVVVSVVLGIGAAITSGQLANVELSPLGIMMSVGLVVAASQASYQTLKKTEIVAALENATSPKPTEPVAPVQDTPVQDPPLS